VKLDLKDWVNKMKLLELDFKHSIKDEVAYKSLQVLKLPNKKIEAFKKVDLSDLYTTSYEFNLSDNISLVDFEKYGEFINDDFYTIFIFNSSIQTNDQDNQYIHISQTNKEKNDSKNALFHLSESFIELENKIEISESLDKPLCIVNISNSNNTFSPSSLHISIKNASTVDLLEVFVSSNQGECFLNINRKITLDKNVILNYSKIEKSSKSDSYIFNYDSNLMKNSTLNIVSVNANAKKSLNLWDFTLDNEGINLNINAIVNIRNEMICANIANIIHNGSNIKSEINVKHILHDKSHGVFEVKSTINNKASNSKVFQSSKTTLLSDDARIDAQPQLLILTDKLEAKHSATCGAINEEELYYLISRGIPLEKAQTMLIESIEIDIIEKIENKIVRDFVIKYKGKNNV